MSFRPQHTPPRTPGRGPPRAAKSMLASPSLPVLPGMRQFTPKRTSFGRIATFQCGAGGVMLEKERPLSSPSRQESMGSPIPRTCVATSVERLRVFPVTVIGRASRESTHIKFFDQYSSKKRICNQRAQNTRTFGNQPAKSRASTRSAAARGGRTPTEERELFSKQTHAEISECFVGDKTTQVG